MLRYQVHELVSKRLKALLPGGLATLMLLLASLTGWLTSVGAASLLVLASAWLAGILWSQSVPHGGVPGRAERMARGAQALGDQLGSLLAQEATGIDEEVQRISCIVQEAAANLGRSFHSINQQLAPGVAADSQAPAAASPAGPENPADKIRRDVADIVRCLQFEDLVTQSMSSVGTRVQRLHALGQLLDRLADLAYVRDAEQVRCLREDLAAFSAGAISKKHEAVDQQSLAGGEVELF